MVVVNAFRTYGQNDKFFPFYYLVCTSTQCKKANTSKYQIIQTSAISVDGWGIPSYQWDRVEKSFTKTYHENRVEFQWIKTLGAKRGQFGEWGACAWS